MQYSIRRTNYPGRELEMKFRKTSDQAFRSLDKGTNVTGELQYSCTVRMDGTFHCSISSAGMLIIAEHARVHADIKACEIEIHGQVFGSVEAKRRAEVSAAGRVRGDLRTPVLIVSPGALLDGHVQMAADGPEEITVATQPLAEQENSLREM